MAKLATEAAADVHRLIKGACWEATALIYAKPDDPERYCDQIKRVYTEARKLRLRLPWCRHHCEVPRYLEACILTPRQQEAVYGMSGPSWHHLAVDLVQRVTSIVHWAVRDAIPVDEEFGLSVAPYMPDEPYRFRPVMVGGRMPKEIRADPQRFAPIIENALAEMRPLLNEQDNARMAAGLTIEAQAVDANAKRLPRNPKEERDAWLTAEWNNGKSWKAIQMQANRRWPNDELASVQAVKAAVKRYCTRNTIGMRSGKAGRPKCKTKRVRA